VAQGIQTKGLDGGLLIWEGVSGTRINRIGVGSLPVLEGSLWAILETCGSGHGHRISYPDDDTVYYELHQMIEPFNLLEVESRPWFSALAFVLRHHDPVDL
jgi:hypothetical protein